MYVCVCVRPYIRVPVLAFLFDNMNNNTITMYIVLDEPRTHPLSSHPCINGRRSYFANPEIQIY